MSKHTPGPWKVGQLSHAQREFRQIAAPGRVIAWTSCTYDKELGDVVTAEDEANTALMAAAPDLLDAVEQLLIYLGDWEDMDNDTCRLALAAVAKAKGQERSE